MSRANFASLSLSLSLRVRSARRQIGPTTITATSSTEGIKRASSTVWWWPAQCVCTTHTTYRIRQTQRQSTEYAHRERERDERQRQKRGLTGSQLIWKCTNTRSMYIYAICMQLGQWTDDMRRTHNECKNIPCLGLHTHTCGHMPYRIPKYFVYISCYVNSMLFAA